MCFTFKKGTEDVYTSRENVSRSSTLNIGTLVSVVIAAGPDEDTTTSSILLPAIRLPESRRQGSDRIDITTVTNTTTIAGA